MTDRHLPLDNKIKNSGPTSVLFPPPTSVVFSVLKFRHSPLGPMRISNCTVIVSLRVLHKRKMLMGCTWQDCTNVCKVVLLLEKLPPPPHKSSCDCQASDQTIWLELGGCLFSRVDKWLFRWGGGGKRKRIVIVSSTFIPLKLLRQYLHFLSLCKTKQLRILLGLVCASAFLSLENNSIEKGWQRPTNASSPPFACGQGFLNSFHSWCSG